MSDIVQREGEVVHELPDDLAATIGRVIVAYARIEHNLTSLIGLILQLNKPEMRLVLRMPRVTDRLEIVLDLFALKALVTDVDTVSLKGTLEQVATERDQIAHGIWIKHPETGQLHLRIARGQWPKNLTEGERISRAVYPQSIPYSVENAKSTLQLCEVTMRGVDQLGWNLDHALQAWPERFRELSPLLKPLGGRKPRHPKPARRSPRPKSQN